jgi:hypothetical protein
MARSVAEIYSQMDAQRQGDSSLSGLTSVSQTALYKLWMYVVAFALHIHESIFDIFRAEIETKIATQRVHTASWYRNQALLFQYDPNNSRMVLDIGEYTPAYSVIAPDKRIITRCTVREGGREIYVKVNKGESPNIQPLSALELSAFRAYMGQIKDAGTRISVQSFPAEKVILKIEIDNSIVNGQITAPQCIEIAQNFLRDLPFDGSISIQKLEAAFLADSRIKNLKLNQLLVTNSEGFLFGEVFSLIKGINEKTYLTASGHAVLNVELSELQINAV